jgi:uncharacterized protein (TIGR03032 family)
MTDTLPPFSCTCTPGLAELLAELGCSLVLSTYQAGKVVIFSAGPHGLVQLPRNFNKPMGLAVEGQRMAIATRDEVVVLANAAALAESYAAGGDSYDSLFVPRATYFCGELDLHDLAWHNQTLWAVNTRFSCLCQIDDRWSFVPHWQPAFVSALTPDDRCHLNGLALVDGVPLYVTALGATDTPKGWRAHKLDGGVLVHVPSGEIVAGGLRMPHSPRTYAGRLYLLNSAAGELATLDPATGKAETIARLPGFARGLARYGDYLFVGMSKLRPGRSLGGSTPLAQHELACGWAAVHMPSGRVVGSLQYLNSCQEIYDIQVLPGLRRPGILGIDQPLYRSALSTPDQGFWGQPASQA